MDPTELDTLYATLSEAIGRVGEARAPLFLATLALDLIARQPDGLAAAAAIERAERLTRL